MADKTAGDYAVEIEKEMANNTVGNSAAVVAEMKAASAPKEGDPPAETPEAPPPTDQGLAVYAAKLDAAISNSNVAEARALCEEMKTVAPPTPPPPAEPAAPPA